MSRIKCNVALGRFQPFTKGHLQMLKDGFDKNGYPAVVFMISNKKFDSKHPFSDELITKEMDIVKKNYKFVVETVPASSADIVKIGERLNEMGYEAHLWLCGDDREAQYKRQAENPKYRQMGMFPDDFTTYTGTGRTEGVSGTAVRNSLKTGDRKMFKSLMPDGTDIMFDEMQKAIGSIKESLQDYIVYALPILDYINEAKMKREDFHKHGYMYVRLLLQRLLNGEDVRLGSDGTSGTVNIDSLTADEQGLAKEMLDDILNDDLKNVTIDNFNKIFKSANLTLTSFFKGDYSGYANGLDSGNRGNAFEQYFIDNYTQKFEKDIQDLTGYTVLNEITRDGGKNTRRPLKFYNEGIIFGTEGKFDIGEDVTDVTLSTDKGPVYLSLKYGSQVTFINAGIKKYIPTSFFTSGDSLPVEGKGLLDMLCIDEDRMRQVFTSYNKDSKKTKSEKDNVDITEKLKSKTAFKDFMRSVMGYGYIMVHQISGDNVEYISLQTKEDLDKYINDIRNAYVSYPKNGNAKRVDVIIEYDNIKFKINLRSKQSDIVYPTHLMADYTFKK